jgi:site-specific DNA recombinase
MNIICYQRVSSRKQAEKSPSIQHQEDILRIYCESHNYNIIDSYSENHSGRTFDRPEWKKMMAYINQNKGEVDLILCLRWDRFACNTYEAMTVIRDLNQLGVQVNTVEQPLDLTNPGNKFMLSFYLAISEVEHDRRSYRMMERKRTANKI